MVEVERQGGGGDRREEREGSGGGGGGGGRGTMVASQLVLVNHFFLALVHNTPDPATVPDFNSVMVDAGCGRGCRLCSPVNGCLACEPPFFLVLQRDGVRQTASCTKTCPRGFFKVKKKRNGFCSKCTMLGCEECLGPHYCSTCQPHYFNYFGRCIRESPGKNKTQKLGTTTEHTTTTDDERRKDGDEEETKTEEVEKEKEAEEEGIQIMITSPFRPFTTVTNTSTTPNTSLPSPTILPTLQPSPSPVPFVPTPATPSSPSSKRDRLRPCRRRWRRRKHKLGMKNTERQNRRRNRNKERRKDVINRRRQCKGRGRGGRRGRRKGRRWGGRRREKKSKPRITNTTLTNTTITNTTLTNITITNTTITNTITTIMPVTTEMPTTTQMIDLSLLGEEGQEGNSHLSGSSTQVDGQKFFYNNRPREMARFKQSNSNRRRKPAYVRGKKVRHAKIG